MVSAIARTVMLVVHARTKIAVMGSQIPVNMLLKFLHKLQGDAHKIARIEHNVLSQRYRLTMFVREQVSPSGPLMKRYVSVYHSATRSLPSTEILHVKLVSPHDVHLR